MHSALLNEKPTPIQQLITIPDFKKQVIFSGLFLFISPGSSDAYYEPRLTGAHWKSISEGINHLTLLFKCATIDASIGSPMKKAGLRLNFNQPWIGNKQSCSIDGIEMISNNSVITGGLWRCLLPFWELQWLNAFIEVQSSRYIGPQILHKYRDYSRWKLVFRGTFLAFS